MSARPLTWIVCVVAGTALGFWASLTFCEFRIVQHLDKATAEIKVFGLVVHKEEGAAKSNLSGHLRKTWGPLLHVAFAGFGCLMGISIAAVIRRVNRIPFALPVDPSGGPPATGRWTTMVTSLEY